ncbi:hypothetical protein OH76DRAFT_1058896 [Lentinus brumalis]|uniref:Uncharacterized protein n=1 Tax=Lentinus brumalis TaxID=2498619 RepID=A0A371DNC3_9APHY|nr:hypothetical protein OH76DRAFT_1058896 [Polyporus brumalis]
MRQIEDGRSPLQLETAATCHSVDREAGLNLIWTTTGPPCCGTLRAILLTSFASVLLLTFTYRRPPLAIGCGQVAEGRVGELTGRTTPLQPRLRRTRSSLSRPASCYIVDEQLGRGAPETATTSSLWRTCTAPSCDSKVPDAVRLAARTSTASTHASMWVSS